MSKEAVALDHIQQELKAGRFNVHRTLPSNGTTPLHQVAAIDLPKSSEVAELLLKNGADIDKLCNERG
jgi:hypothetical protein